MLLAIRIFSIDSVAAGRGLTFGLILEGFTLTQISKKGAKSRPWALSTQREDAEGRDLVPFFEVWAKVKKKSEIKLPLTVDTI